ncbi:MAG TPA: hypothetical protein PK095_18690, partial [Myxococcota bacterium]|nr:hypothetical protein [Myxococcota bacterium]
MTVARALLNTALAALALSLTSGASSARADGPPESGAGWLQLKTGVTFADAATVDGFVALEGNGDPAMVFGLG